MKSNLWGIPGWRALFFRLVKTRDSLELLDERPKTSYLGITKKYLFVSG